MTLASPGRDRAKARPTARRDRVSGRPRRISPRRDPDRPVSGCPTRDSRSTRSSPAQNPRFGAVSGNCGCRPSPIGSGAHGIGDDLRGHANHRFSIVSALPSAAAHYGFLHADHSHGSGSLHSFQPRKRVAGQRARRGPGSTASKSRQARRERRDARPAGRGPSVQAAGFAVNVLAVGPGTPA